MPIKKAACVCVANVFLKFEIFKHIDINLKLKHESLNLHNDR